MRFKKQYVYLFLLFFTVSRPVFSTEKIEIERVRQRYALAIESAEQTENLLKHLTEIRNPSPLLIAYKGGAEALMAKHSWNPYNKFYYLKKSQQTLKQAIKLDPENAEIRFLRFSIQHFTPAFLGMSDELEEDKKTIIANINTTQGEVRNAIVKFLIESGRCSTAELKLLKNNNLI